MSTLLTDCLGAAVQDYPAVEEFIEGIEHFVSKGSVAWLKHISPRPGKLVAVVIDQAIKCVCFRAAPPPLELTSVIIVALALVLFRSRTRTRLGFGGHS